MSNTFYKNISCHSNNIVFENERALSYTTLLKKSGKKANKKFIVIDKYLDITFSLEMPLELRSGGCVYMYPSNPLTFRVMGADTSVHNTMKKYYESIGESWEQFKNEFFTEYSRTVNPMLFQMEDK
ncbi:hypothetical protein [Priestia megaterium]|jgi:hypothetical protein|uniref:hypothetical protein n=1 Tax=Priestia megaterium TaxID=1404 RepID=UPI00207AF559|nr:hypothetical protein [Priestia megaterium]USL45568.1 hypothetical protein LIS78_29695 [Priestia megaterium]